MLSIPGIENLPPAVKYLIAFAIIFALLALFALVLRRLTGGRLTLANERGRARQPRLGIVDVYDLDRQRQLILLRRDNVEHLLLVGGPNDVVIETNIVRVPGARLPAGGPEGVTDRLEAAAAERPPEIAPVRPVVEAPVAVRPTARAVEPVVAALGRAEPAVPVPAAPPARATSPRGDVQARPAPASPPATPRALDRPRATPVAAATQSGSAARAAAISTPRSVSPAAQAAEEPRGPAARPPLTDMARQLADVLNRPEGAPAGARQPQARLQAAPGTAPSPNPPESRPALVPPDESPAPAEEAAPTEPAGNGGQHGAAPEVVPAPVRPSPPPVGAAPPATPPAPSEPAPAPPRLVEPVRPPEPAPPPARPAPDAPSPPSPRPDPFSIEDIEAEFARLLGRPLDRKDRS